MVKRRKRTILPPVDRRKRKHLQTGTLFIIVGAAAIAAAAAIWLYNEYDNRRAAESSQATVETILEIIRSYDPPSVETGNNGGGMPVNPPDDSVTADLPDTDMAGIEDSAPVTADTDGETPYVVIEREAYMGILSIPRLALKLPVNLAWSYAKLKTSPCRYSGDVEHNDFVIAAHSYKSHFGNINTLTQGDAVIFTDVEGRVFTYYVAAIEVVHPSNTRSVVTSIYDLTLFTCTFDSRSRVVVRCFRAPEPEEEPQTEFGEEPADLPPEKPAAETSPEEPAEEPEETPTEEQHDEPAAEPEEEQGAAPEEESAAGQETEFAG